MISLRLIDIGRNSSLTRQSIPENTKTAGNKAGNIDSAADYSIICDEDNITIKSRRSLLKDFVIHRKTLEGSFRDSKHVDGSALPIFAVWGAIQILDIEFLVVITKATKVTEIFSSPIYGINSVKFFTIEAIKHNNLDYERCWEQLRRIKGFMRSGFYFSYNYSLTTAFDGVALSSTELALGENTLGTFAWNRPALRIINGNLEDGFFVPIIQGFVASIFIGIGTYSIISRRSYIMGGTRYNARGVNNDGYVANFVETEGILEVSDQVFCFRQLRGSLPFYWQQSSDIKRRVSVHQPEDINEGALTRHFEMIYNQGFTQIVALNLLSAERKDEYELTEYFERLLSERKTGQNAIIYYEYIDFHELTTETDFSAVSSRIDAIRSQYNFDDDRWSLDLLNGGLLRQRVQSIVLRTNCLDCLDRTNAVQTIIAVSFAQDWLKDWRENKKCDFLALKSDWIELLRGLYADNGDMLSMIYAGTGATTSSTTRRGERPSIVSIFDHGIKTLSRFYLNNFDDEYKQQTIDSLLTQHVSFSAIKKQETISQSAAFISIVPHSSKVNLQFESEFLEKLLLGANSAAFVLITICAQQAKTTITNSKEEYTFKNFREAFSTSIASIDSFELLRYVNDGAFEVLLFCRRDTISAFQYFKSEDAKGSYLQNSRSLRACLLFEGVSVQLLTAYIVPGFFDSSPSDSLTSLIEDASRPHKHIICFAGSIEAESIYKLKNNNYVLAIDETVLLKHERTRVNKLFVLRSKAFFTEFGTCAFNVKNLNTPVEMSLNGYLCNFTI